MDKGKERSPKRRAEAERREQGLRDSAAIRGISVEELKRQIAEFKESKR